MKRNLLAATLVCFLTAVDASAAGAAPTTEPLTVERIMARDWIGTPPENPYWGDDGRSVYYSRRRPGSDIVDLRRIDLGNGKDEVVEPRARATADYPGVWSVDRKIKAWIRDGDVYAKRVERRSTIQLTRTTDEERDVLVLLDGRVAFRRGDAFLAADLDSGRQETLADIRFAKDPDEIKDPDGFLEEEQRKLFRVLHERVARKEERLAQERSDRQADATRAPRPFFFGEDRSLVAGRVSPTGRRVLIATGPKHASDRPDPAGAEGGKEDDMAVFVTESGYVEDKKVRPKVGTGKPETPSIFLLDLATSRRVELDLSKLPGLADDPLADFRARAEAKKKERAEEQKKKAEREGTEAPEDKPASAPESAKRPLRLDDVVWSEDGASVALQLYSIDNKDRWIVAVDPATGAVSPFYRQTDPAWLGWRFTELGWTRDSRALWYLSEETGYSHLYVQPRVGARRALTTGSFEVDRPLLSRDGKTFFVSANREQAGVYEAYRVRLDGGPLERLTWNSGMTYAIPSLDERRLLLTSSWATKPPELYVQTIGAKPTPERLTHTTSTEFAAVPWVEPEIVEIPSRHYAGRIQARLYDARSKPAAAGPAVLFVHGAGYLQNAHAGWSGYWREFMFHTLLARAGYVVLDMDYRASSGYGRDHRTAIYRRMGWPEVEDLEDGVAFLVDGRGVDPKRVGVYGGSYGGFLTLMSMFRKPDLFAAGAALRPVTDWAHYNHSYTSAILNTPELDPEAYTLSSPIEYAQGLTKTLLLCHGMVDDNVTFQDTVRLVQRLIELGKTDDFETAIYPVEPHGFDDPASWTDEYKRILKLFETHLK